MAQKELINYSTLSGRYPFEEWLLRLQDRKGRSIILARLDRFEITGNPGNTRNLGDGVYELKIFYGPGYRIYYAIENENIVLLLNGGDKSKQSKDIEKAKEYWLDYRRRFK